MNPPMFGSREPGEEISLSTLALSPKRGGIIRRFNRKPGPGLARWTTEEPENRLLLFPLPGGEGQGEGERQTILFFAHSPRTSKGRR